MFWSCLKTFKETGKVKAVGEPFKTYNLHSKYVLSRDLIRP